MESNIVQECLKNLSSEIKNFDLLSDTSEIWQNISMDLIAPILKYARAMGKCYDWPILRATDYLEFSKNGSSKKLIFLFGNNIIINTFLNLKLL